MHADFCAALARIHRVADAQAHTVDAPFVEGHRTGRTADEPRLELIYLVRAQAHVVLAGLERLIRIVQVEEGIERRER